MSASPNSAIVRIRKANGEVVGAGFLIDVQHVVTCAHVVNSALGRPRSQAERPAEPVILDFPLFGSAKERTFTGRIDDWYPPEAESSPADTAVLTLTNVPNGARPVTLARAVDGLWGQPTRSVGFPRGHDDGVWWSGTTRSLQARGWLQVDAALDTQYFVEQGFSGAPVWTGDGRVIGMVVQAEITEDTRAAYLVPATILAPMLPSPAPALPPPSGAPRTRDHVFISYAHADRALVDRIAADLRRHGHITWTDFEGIRGGDVWRQAIVDGIDASAAVLVALSPDAVRSEWVALELRAALDLHKRVIPLLARPLTTADDRAAYQHLNIEHIQYRDFTGGYDAAFAALLDDLPPPKVGIPGHCARVAADLSSRPWGLAHYIQSEARLLPIDASPYEDGAVRGQPEKLIQRLRPQPDHSQRVIILGEPGMGKTVALERLAWELATGDPLSVVPILIKLFEYGDQPLLEEIYLNLRRHGEIKHRDRDETRAFLMDERQPRCYFLLDGLNEVRPEHRAPVLAEIRRLALEFPRHHLAITSRVQDDGWQQLRQGTAPYDTFLVQPIHPDQARAYLDAHLESGDGSLLWGQLDEKMCELATTPLLLWLIKEAWLEAREYQETGPIRMPDNRGALYKSFVSRLLKRDDERRLTEQVSQADRLAALQTLARTMHEVQALTITRSEAQALVRNQTTLEALLVNGLLAPVGADRLRFAPHQTLQEHFAACAIQPDVMRKVKATGLMRRINRGVLRCADDPWWAETFIQLAGLTDDPNALARALAEVNPWLALWCVQEGRQVDDATREVIRKRSEALVQSPDVQDRRRAAEALVRLQTPRVIEPLAVLSLDTNASVARTALQGLLTLGEAGERAFMTQLGQKSPDKRAQWGLSIADIDPRPGVGLRTDGLPGIDWVEIPAGKFIYQDGQKLTLPAFHICRYPVTYRQFQAFIDAPDGFRNPQWWVGLAADNRHKAAPGEQAFPYWNHPRERVS